jgi:polyferredoxin
MYPLDVIPVLLSVLFARAGWNAASAQGTFRLSMARLARDRRPKRPVLFWSLVMLASALGVVFLAMMVGGVVLGLREFPATVEHVRTQGRSLPSGTYSGWSLLLFFGGCTVVAAGFLVGLVRGVRDGIEAARRG